RLIRAYRRGIFPWYEAPQPVMWWTPDPRSILLPHSLHISRSLRKTLQRNAFKLSVDQCFATVVKHCAETREDGPGTWIGDDMLRAYSGLHQQGIAHSIEVYDVDEQLVGGLYGIALGQAFFGESMFSLKSDASKVALVALVHMLKPAGFQLIDCQVESDHMNSLGAVNVGRVDFERLLVQTVDVNVGSDIWSLPPTCGELL
ncbi:MAG: leucyl/phenylalanyl-tRNA--protein transferase, partial [Proteobacteria bacterium]|nr:leucyl/phenylalanyl-tRNA--protein transferase [Pseudomonadota bacterium]